ncbi:MAG: hypothetical protein MI867_06150 [Pseudomonadales bacterium]|nr:hypothetical protein [Pseudomonadales bacterium]
MSSDSTNVVEAAGDTGNSMTMDTKMSMDHPCGHCPDEPVSNDCQFDDWGSPNQAHNLSLDFKPAITLDKLIAVISLSEYKPSELASTSNPDHSVKARFFTPTEKQDILRC